MVLLEVRQRVDGIFAVQHANRLSVLQMGGAVGHRQEMAGRFGSISRHDSREASGHYGDKGQPGRHSHRAGSFRGESGMTLSSSHDRKTELAFLDDRYRLNQ